MSRVFAFCCSAILVSIGLEPVNAQEPPDHLLVAASSGSDFYVPIKAIINDNNFRPRVWIHEDAKKNTKVKYRSAKMLYDFDCKEKRLKAITTTQYNADGTVQNSIDFEYRSDWNYVVPDSVAEAWLKSVCPTDN